MLPYRLRGELALSRSAHDRVGERRRDAEWLAAVEADPGTRVLDVHRGRARVRDGRLVLVAPAEASEGERVLLGTAADGTTYLAVLARDADDAEAALDAAEPDGELRTLREVGAQLSALDAGLLTHAVAVAGWHERHPRCPRCGAPTVVAEAGAVRRCPVDGSEHYPRTDPAIIVAVVDADERVLLGRQAVWPPGRFSTLAGFVEPGESLEAAVAREVHEETGIVVDEVAYAGSQPWPFPSSLMLGFFAAARTTAIRVDGEEIADARWFSREALLAALEDGSVGLPPRVSIARRLIEGWYGAELPEAPPWDAEVRPAASPAGPEHSPPGGG